MGVPLITITQESKKPLPRPPGRLSPSRWSLVGASSLFRPLMRPMLLLDPRSICPWDFAASQPILPNVFIGPIHRALNLLKPWPMYGLSARDLRLIGLFIWKVLQSALVVCRSNLRRFATDLLHGRLGLLSSPLPVMDVHEIARGRGSGYSIGGWRWLSFSPPALSDKWTRFCPAKWSNKADAQPLLCMLKRLRGLFFSFLLFSILRLHSRQSSEQQWTFKASKRNTWPREFERWRPIIVLLEMESPYAPLVSPEPLELFAA